VGALVMAGEAAAHGNVDEFQPSVMLASTQGNEMRAKTVQY